MRIHLVRLMSLGPKSLISIVRPLLPELVLIRYKLWTLLPLLIVRIHLGGASPAGKAVHVAHPSSLLKRASKGSKGRKDAPGGLSASSSCTGR